MSYDTFPVTAHHCTIAYPKGDVVQFGRGYQFTTTPQKPMQRRFRLYFEALVWFLNSDGTVDTATHPECNVGLLKQWFEQHDYSTPFIYVHPTEGNVVVKWAADQPFEIPKSLKGGSGATEPLELAFVEQPGL